MDRKLIKIGRKVVYNKVNIVNHSIYKNLSSTSLGCSIICSGFSDFLKYTLPRNKRFFDQIIVVTSKNDYETIKICNLNNVSYVVEETFDVNGNFSEIKSRNLGFKNLSTDWILSLDADIIINNDIKSLLKNLNIEYLYGCYRKIYDNYNDWKLKKGKIRKFVGHGYFQLFNTNSATYKSGIRYEESNKDWRKTKADTIFRNRWSKVHKLPIVVDHLGPVQWKIKPCWSHLAFANV